MVPNGQHHIQLGELVVSDKPLSHFIRSISIDSFKSLLHEMLQGPDLQTSNLDASLRSNLDQFYNGVRTALELQGNQLLVALLNGKL